MIFTEWNIVPFVGMGPIKFGMSPIDVSALLGEPESESTRGGVLREIRANNVPMIRYEHNKVTEIEAFYSVEDVTLDTLNIFEDNGREVLNSLEAKNGGALLDVGIIMFDNLGITTGRLDEDVRGEHSITAFCKGYWDEDMEDFEKTSFK